MTADGYDLIVVGAGSAGATLAGRLAARGTKRVLLIEAGPAWRSSEMPGAVHATDPAPVGSRGVKTYREVHWQDLPARRTAVQPSYHYPRGRGLGGTSNVNAQMAIRPPLEDFAAWERCSPIWSRKAVLDSFVRLETDHDFPDASYHGDRGPIPVARLPEWGWGSLAHQLAEAAVAAGHGWCDDHNAPDTTGVSPQALNRKDGRRVTTNDAYLEPVRNQKYLDIVGDALVDRVLFDRAETAMGVRYNNGVGVHDVHGGEVVLAAGAIGSPSILMRSGIGPADRIAAASLPVRVDLPVGLGLQEHAMVSLLLPTDLPLEAPPLLHQAPLVVRFQPEGGRTNDTFIYPMTFSDRPAGLTVKLATSSSAGGLWITSADPAAPPMIELNLLGSQADVGLMRAAVRHLATLLSHDTWKGLGRRAVSAQTGTALEDIVAADDRTLAGLLLREVVDGFHLTSTCRMGTPEDGTSVVDGDGRVHGTDHLRVVDVSICPTIVRANTHLTAVMVAERFADLLA